MPSPIGHTVAGILLLILRRQIDHWRELFCHWKEGCFLIFLALLPDIDFFNPTLMKFDLNSPYHHQWTHSIMFAFSVGLLILVMNRALAKKWQLALTAWSLLALFSHLFLDLIFSNIEPSLQLFWPFSDRSINHPFQLYYSWDHERILAASNLVQLATELVVGLGLIGIFLGYHSYRRERGRL